MRLAFVHCRLYPGGALEVFKDLIQQELTSHPDAEMKVFTMIADKDLQQLTLPLPGTDRQKTLQVIQVLPKWITTIFTTCSRQNISIFSALFDYRNLIVFYPQVMRILSRKIRVALYSSLLVGSLYLFY